jgi:deoxyribose-phosphate aldolase
MSSHEIETFARSVDHTLLRPAATADEIDQLCGEAAASGFASVCIYPWWVDRAVARLDGRVPVCTVVGFPHGLDRTPAKVESVRTAIAAGTAEIDAVIAFGAIRSADTAAAARDAAAVVDAAHREAALVKLIVESAQLGAQELDAACDVVAASGAEFGKTSTGFAGGATVDAVRAMRARLPERVHVKASAGIRDAATAQAMLEAGATRIGTSSAMAILGELERSAVA